MTLQQLFDQKTYNNKLRARYRARYTNEWRIGLRSNSELDKIIFKLMNRFYLYNLVVRELKLQAIDNYKAVSLMAYNGFTAEDVIKADSDLYKNAMYEYEADTAFNYQGEL